MEDEEKFVNSLLLDKLTKLVVPEVEGLRVCGSQTLDGGRPAQFHAHQLVCDPEGGGEVHVQLDPLADTGGHVVVPNTEVGP